MTEPSPGVALAEVSVVADGTVTHADGRECGGPSCTYPPHAAMLAGSDAAGVGE